MLPRLLMIGHHAEASNIFLVILLVFYTVDKMLPYFSRTRLPRSATVTAPSAQSVFRNPAWWRRQAWVCSTEILMGFLAAWGFLQGFGVVLVPLGLAVVYAVNALSVSSFARFGRNAALLLALVAASCAAVSLVVVSDSRWWFLCVCSGILLGFRDQQTVLSLAWIPVNAHRQGLCPTRAAAATSVLTTVILSAALLLAGVMTRYWPMLPQMVALLSCCALLPSQITNMRRTPIAPRTNHPAQQKQMSWLLRLSMAFNSVNHTGRRLVLPVAILALGKHYGLGPGYTRSWVHR
jgi:hypothetical protein